MTAPPALLVLEDGTAFRGRSFGAIGTSFGEIVFNTAMTGYQEVLTDPSYRRQVVAMTAPHVGNYGVNADDAESDRIQVAGFVVREAARRPSNWRSQGDIGSYLRGEGVVAMEGVDTRRLTRHVRSAGAMRCAISTDVLDVDGLLQQVLASPRMDGADLARKVTTADVYRVTTEGADRHVVAVDFGAKRSIIRLLGAAGCDVTVVPATTTADEIRALEPDGVFLSNGPGDPSAVTYGIDATRALLGTVPVFGICLGSQLLGLALGGETYKLRFGHRGINQPVLRRSDGAVEISSHNHGFSVDAPSLGEPTGDQRYRTGAHGDVSVSHVNLNDGTCEGLVCHDLPAFGVQYHPEAAPGPHDARYLFDRFMTLMGAR